MLPDLERLIRLQDLELRATASGRIVASAPERMAELDATLAAARERVESAKAVIAENQTARRGVEKDLLAAQQRLEKYKEQSLAVKTNAEFHAMQHQMATVKAEIDEFESRTLEVMMAADDAAAALKAAEQQLKSDETSVARQRQQIEAERAEHEQIVAACTTERATVISEISPALVSIFERVARQRGGVGLARAEKERCAACQLRLRPMVFNEVMRNESIVQCDSCQRILYFVPPGPDDADRPADQAHQGS